MSSDSDSQFSSLPGSSAPTSAFPGVSSPTTDSPVPGITIVDNRYRVRVPREYEIQAPKGSTYAISETVKEGAGGTRHYYDTIEGGKWSIVEPKDDEDWGPEPELDEF